MAQTGGSGGSSLTSDQIAAQLAAISAKLDTILSRLRGDVAEIKSQMIRDGNYCEKADKVRKNMEMEDNLMADKRGEMVYSYNQKTHHQSLKIKSDEPNAMSLDLESESKVGHIEPNRNLVVTPAFKCNLSAVTQSSQSTPKILPHVFDSVKHGRFLACKLLGSGEEEKNTDSEQPTAITITITGDTYDKKEIFEIKWSSRSGVDAKDKEIAWPSQYALPYGWIYEEGQPIIEWLIAWHNNSFLFDLRTSRVSGLEVLIETWFGLVPIMPNGLSQLKNIYSVSRLSFN